MKFVDEAVIKVKSGKGGDGICHFSRTRHNPKGGPDGGDGGRGGDVYLVGDPRKLTLLDFRFRSAYRAEDGKAGGTNFKTGKSGKAVYLKVPLGTRVFDFETRKLVGEITSPEQILLAARGGKGGKGNASFASSANRIPTKATRGCSGEERTLLLVLELIAHVGLVGLPNAGKSTLISVISNAKPKIAEYPFTTLHPVLGIVKWRDSSFVVADLPGIIEGASKGKGLGLKFLKHAKRTHIICHLIEAQNVWQSGVNLSCFLAVEQEIKNYSTELFEKPRVVVVSKMDLAHQDFDKEQVKGEFAKIGYSAVFFVSSLTGSGLKELLDFLCEQLKLPVTLNQLKATR
ncbi:MAG: GTPase ObgE [Deltaproteobacteria bacterium]|nr:GTPase ObgE [Deltaproteobacteria bacterium]